MDSNFDLNAPYDAFYFDYDADPFRDDHEMSLAMGFLDILEKIEIYSFRLLYLT